ncbi:mediator of RNA polymerase II transcription subunit 17-like [Ptychodera flava]|uniref:mediator of RNA polymerase II transcription subunit 17-like n=1 Tax=Ptychodera flava TaxID=63121 RepID=UPI00396A1555
MGSDTRMRPQRLQLGITKMAANGVKVSVEAVLENQIQEVSLDGQETYVAPLSMSENLTKLAHRIDFNKNDDDDESVEKEKADDKVEEEIGKEPTTFQPPQWPWESVRNKLRTALTEVSVLSDVLNIAKEKRYMVLDPVSQDTPQPKPAIQLLSKKKSLMEAASIIVSGASLLFRTQKRMSKVSDFHTELLKLHQNWRLKKVGKAIIGDLSFKTGGSRFWHNGAFEVTKTVESEQGDETVHPLEVSVPSDLSGRSYIHVCIQQEGADPPHDGLLYCLRGRAASDAHWQETLETAQTVLFCKELFAQLAREAVQLKAPIPHLVIGNQIVSHVFPGIQLCITLCHENSANKKNHDTSTFRVPPNSTVLEHSLHQLLRELHQNNLNPSTPHPVTAPIGISKRRRLAGAQAMGKKDLAEFQQSECLLEKLLKQVRHKVLQTRVCAIIDNLARQLPDPCLLAHWSAANQNLQSSVKLQIMSSGYEQIGRTPLQLVVGIDQVKAVCKDGRVIMISYEEHEIKNFLLTQIVQHQINSIQALAKVMGWQVLQSSAHLGVGPMEKIGNAAGIMLISPSGDRVIAVRNGAETGTKVSVQFPKNQQSSTESRSDVIMDSKWDNLGGYFREVNVDKMKGRNLVNKVELLMAALAQ